MRCWTEHEVPCLGRLLKHIHGVATITSRRRQFPPHPSSSQPVFHFRVPFPFLLRFKNETSVFPTNSNNTVLLWTTKPALQRRFFYKGVPYHHFNGRNRPTSYLFFFLLSFLPDASISLDREGAKAHALWPSGQVGHSRTED